MFLPDTFEIHQVDLLCDKLIDLPKNGTEDLMEGIADKLGQSYSSIASQERVRTLSG